MAKKRFRSRGPSSGDGSNQGSGGGSNGGWRLGSIHDVKVRAFTPPGERLEIEARLDALEPTTAWLAVETRKGRRTVCSARVNFNREGAA